MRGLGGVLVFFLVVALASTWQRNDRRAHALGGVAILVAFAGGSWLLSLVLSGAWRATGEPHTGAGVPWIVVAASLAFGLLILYTRGSAALATLAEPTTPDASAKYEDDPAWYSSDWRRDPDDPEQDPGTAGYRLELQGGPLAGRTARLRDSRFRLWVLRLDDGTLAVRGAVVLFSDDIPSEATVEGSYGFSHGDEAMVWQGAEGVGPREES